MDPTPNVLDYHRPVPPRWRAYVKLSLRVVLVLVVVIALGWMVRFAWGAWGRQHANVEYKAGYETLAVYNIPAGTVLLDPSAGRVMSEKKYTTATGHGWSMTLTIPNDPVVEHNLRRMRRFVSSFVYPFATERQTARGTAFVYASIDTFLTRTTPLQMTMHVWEVHRTPGEFPSYQPKFQAFVTQVDFKPSPGRGLPTVLAGRTDTDPSSWTLPLIIDGRDEWIRMDHSKVNTSITSSFGQIKTNHGPYAYLIEY